MEWNILHSEQRAPWPWPCAMQQRCARQITPAITSRRGQPRARTRTGSRQGDPGGYARRWRALGSFACARAYPRGAMLDAEWKSELRNLNEWMNGGLRGLVLIAHHQMSIEA